MGFTAAIVGRPNVGKSTLFNRLVGRKLALVDDTPGVTRDRRQGDARLIDLEFSVLDTAGLEDSGPQTLQGRMRAQTEAAIDEADLTLLMIDAMAGPTPADTVLAQALRRRGEPVVLVANKAEARGSEAGLFDAWRLGLGEPCPISAEHGGGMADLRDAIVVAMGGVCAIGAEETALRPDGDADRPLRVAVVGRPNAGKSTLINRLVGEDRLLTGPEAGITRDSIAVEWAWRGRRFRLFDTAGLRRRARVRQKLERLSVADALRAIRFAEVVVIVLDATVPFEKQDLQIADMVVREGRAPVIVFNKWDLVENRRAALAALREQAERLLPQVRGVRAMPVCGLTGAGMEPMMRCVAAAHAVWNRRVPTARLNRWLEAAQARHPPPAADGRRLRLKFIAQIKARPPTFVVSCNRPGALPEAYTRYLAGGLRETFDLPGVPLRVMYRKGGNPYAPGGR